MAVCLKLIVFILFSFSWLNGLSQEVMDSVRKGTAKGMVMDTAHNYRLQAATLAVYKKTNNRLISYQLSNDYGQFMFKDLPVGIPLYIKVTFIGYSEVKRNFTIDNGLSKVDMGILFVERLSGELSDVVVSSTPPVMMNGDTLEFNADAFLLDPNAVTEDLLKKLPGVIVWGDGSITVNGKEIRSVLVNGKPFLGGETKIATQNIPKNAVEKIQVYKKYLDSPNPFDSTSEINIQLKQGKDIGYFGKFSSGYGTKKRYELDGSLNFFNKTTQVGVVGAGNNTNKMADSVKTILRNSTYKGVGASIDYQPDFSKGGSNVSKAAGFMFGHDFIDEPGPYRQNHLKAGYFFNKNTQEITKSLQSIIALPGDGDQLKKSINFNKQFARSHDGNFRYDNRVSNSSYSLGATFHSLRKNSAHNSSTSMENDVGELLSNSITHGNEFTDGRHFHLDAGFKNGLDSRFTQGGLNEYSLKYALDAGRDYTHEFNNTNFTTGLNSFLDNKHIDRKYNGHETYAKHEINFLLGDFTSGQYKNFWGVSLKFKNDFSYYTKRIDNKVVDRDSLSGHYLTNSYLSVQRKENTYDERPGLRFSKRFFKDLSDRYQKSVTIGLNVGGQFYGLKSNSSHQLQRKSLGYQQFIPSFDLSYINSEFGRFHDNLSFSLKSDYIYPTIEQLVHLVDSSNFYNLQFGNPYLKPSSRKELQLGWFHSEFRVKNTFNYSIFLNAGIVNQYFADSSVTDELGRTSHYLVNEDSRKFIGVNGGVNRAIKIKDNLFLLRLNIAVNYIHNPLYINSIERGSSIVNSQGKLSVSYNYKDNLAINLEEQFVGYHSNLSGVDDGEFDNKLWTTKCIFLKYFATHSQFNTAQKVCFKLPNLVPILGMQIV